MHDGGAAYDEDKRRAMTNCQVYSHWRLLPIEMELAVREVKWLQKICEGGAAHDQLVGALFGELKVGGVRMYDALDAGGKLSHTASPYARKFIANLDLFRPLDTAKDFFTGWAQTGETITSLLGDDDIKEDFMKISPAELRAAFWTRSTNYQPWENIKTALEHHTARQFICQLLNADGDVCGKAFQSYNALIVHQVRARGGGHGDVSPFYCGILTNRCPHCRTTFTTLEGVRNHIKRSFISGRCKRDRSFMNYPVQTLPNYNCPFCSYSTQNLA